MSHTQSPSTAETHNDNTEPDNTHDQLETQAFYYSSLFKIYQIHR